MVVTARSDCVSDFSGDSQAVSVDVVMKFIFAVGILAVCWVVWVYEKRR